ncbi:MAG: VTT domain-containing protein [Myxococcota bacterium]
MTPRRKRIALLALLFVAVFAWVDMSGLRESLTQDRLQALLDSAGVMGVVLFIAVFSAGQLAQVPGIVFVLTARAAWGPAIGFAVAYVGALCAVSVSFCAVRTAAGAASTDEPKREPRGRWARAIEKLAARPRLTVASLRALLALSPPLNIALAMTSLRPRDHLIGSAVGLLVPIAGWILLSDVLVRVVSHVL